MGTLKITIVVTTDPAEHDHVHTQAVGIVEADVRPMLDRAVSALVCEREALDACPYHARATLFTKENERGR